MACTEEPCLAQSQKWEGMYQRRKAANIVEKN